MTTESFWCQKVEIKQLKTDCPQKIITKMIIKKTISVSNLIYEQEIHFVHRYLQFNIYPGLEIGYNLLTVISFLVWRN